MHEWSLVESLIAEAERQAQAHGARAVRRLWLRVGEHAGVEIPLLERAYAVFRERSCCAGATLEVETVPARWVCTGCGRDLPAGAGLRCPACATPGRLASGDEIVLARLELEVETGDAPHGALAGEGS